MNYAPSAIGRALSGAMLFLLASLPLSLSAQEAATNTGPGMPPEFIQKMLQLVTDKGTNREMPANFASALGFTKPHQTWTYRGLIGAEDDGHQHSFNFGLRSSQEIAIVVRDLKTIHASRVDADGKVLAAIEIDLTNGDFTMRTPADAQSEVNAEIDLWTSKVDALLAAKKSK